MGSITPPPPVIGERCTRCESLLWPIGKTPRFAKLTFLEVVTCPGAPHAAPDGSYYLEQAPGFPCVWEYGDSAHDIELAYGPGISHVVCWDAVLWTQEYFRDEPAVECVVDFVNDHVDCDQAQVEGINGTCTVELP